MMTVLMARAVALPEKTEGRWLIKSQDRRGGDMEEEEEKKKWAGYLSEENTLEEVIGH